MSSDNKLDKNGLSYFWSKVTAYIQDTINYGKDAFTFIGNTPMGTVATTITGAIKEVVDKIGNTQMGTTATTITGAIKEHNDKIGDTTMGTTATTLTGAIAEHETDISDLTNKIRKGSGSTDSNGQLVINFSPAFSQTPIIVANTGGSSTTTITVIKVSSVSTSSATLLAMAYGGTNIYPLVNNTVRWIAIGS